MSHIPYTICRHGMIYYSRRVPKNAVKQYGSHIRLALSRDPIEAANYAKKLTPILQSFWVTQKNIRPVDLSLVLDNIKPRVFILSELTQEYIELKNIQANPTLSSVNILISLCGDINIESYDRQDAKTFISNLQSRGNKTGTIRRRIHCLSAIFNYGHSELDLQKRNPFSRLIIRNEGQDKLRRGVFTFEQLKLGYDKAINSGSDIKLIFPILGETGCRLAEIVGLRVEDIDFANQVIRIRPNAARRLKTQHSTRILPLVGYALKAIELAMEKSDGVWLFPRYIKEGHCFATHSSNALNKWAKKDFDGLTAHSLRHTMRDRLRAVECPTEMIDQIGGWADKSIGQSYGAGYPINVVRRWLSQVRIEAD